MGSPVSADQTTVVSLWFVIPQHVIVSEISFKTFSSDCFTVLKISFGSASTQPSFG